MIRLAALGRLPTARSKMRRARLDRSFDRAVASRAEMQCGHRLPAKIVQHAFGHHHIRRQIRIARLASQTACRPSGSSCSRSNSEVTGCFRAICSGPAQRGNAVIAGRVANCQSATRPPSRCREPQNSTGSRCTTTSRANDCSIRRRIAGSSVFQTMLPIGDGRRDSRCRDRSISSTLGAPVLPHSEFRHSALRQPALLARPAPDALRRTRRRRPVGARPSRDSASNSHEHAATRLADDRADPHAAALGKSPRHEHLMIDAAREIRG